MGVRIPLPLPVSTRQASETEVGSEDGDTSTGKRIRELHPAGLRLGPLQVKNYFEELQLEMRRVTWPSWKQVRATTLVVIIAVFAFAAYFAVVDQVVAGIINKLFTALSR